MKIKPQELLRWVLAPLLAACLLGWLAAPAYPESTKPKTPELKQTADKQTNPITVTPTEVQEFRKLMDELQARERDNYALGLEGQRKTMDWWFSFLAVVTAVMAIVGPLIVFMMGHRDRELVKEDREQIKNDKVQIERDKEEIRHLLDAAQKNVAEISQNKTKSEKFIEDFIIEKDGKTNEAKTNEAKEAVAAVQNDPASSPALKLRAKAIEASVPEQADRAYKLWYALTELDTTDANAHFNAGYWASALGRKSQGGDSLHWFKQAEQHYAQTLSLKPNKHQAAYNWGNALKAEAQTIAASDIDAARKLWRQAGEKYQQAIRIKPDYHKAANSWGASLLRESSALASTDDTQTRLLRDRAEQLLLQHAEAAPGTVAYNLARVYGLRGDIAPCLRWLKTSQDHKTLPDRDNLKKDPDLNAVRNAPEFIEWLQTVCPQETK